MTSWEYVRETDSGYIFYADVVQKSFDELLDVLVNTRAIVVLYVDQKDRVYMTQILANFRVLDKLSKKDFVGRMFMFGHESTLEEAKARLKIHVNSIVDSLIAKVEEERPSLGADC